MKRIALVLSLACLMSAGCKKSDSSSAADLTNPLSSPTAPTNPANTNLSGTWTGTLSRPGDLGPVAVRWVASQVSGNIVQVSGPFTMTYNGASVQGTLGGPFSGGSNSPGSLLMQIQLPAGASSAFPTCSVTAGGIVVSAFPVAATSLSSSAFDITYNSCVGFIAPSGITNFTRESTVLSLTKQ